MFSNLFEERDKKVLEGIRYAYQYTQEEYAKRFIDGVKNAI